MRNRTALLVVFLFVAQIATAEETVTVTPQNATFQIRGSWKSGVKEGKFNHKDPFKVPVGKVAFHVDSRHTNGWLQPFELAAPNVGRTGSAWIKLTLDIEPGEEWFLTLGDPSYPWNAELVRHQGLAILVTLERPVAKDVKKDIEDYKKGEWPRPEEFPYSMPYWEKYGDEGYARLIVQAFLEHRGDPENVKGGKIRRHHISLIVLSDSEGVMATITEEVLQKKVVEALKKLRTKRTLYGETIEGLIKGSLDLVKPDE